MNSIDLYFNLIGLIAGVYCLYTWFKLKKEKKLFANQLLIPKDAKPSDCLDEKAYIRLMSPCLLLIGLVWGLIGAAGFINQEWPFLGESGTYWLGLGGSILCVVTFGIYVFIWLRARKLYWAV